MARRVKLWLDEDLSPTLVQIAQASGYLATCNRDRGRLGCQDPELLQAALDEDYVFVTNNKGDFTVLCEAAEVHSGLILLPSVARRDGQRLLGAAIDHIRAHSHESGCSEAYFMVNRVIEVDEAGYCHDYDLPSS